MATDGDDFPPAPEFMFPSSVPEVKQEELLTADNKDDSESLNELSAEDIWSKIKGCSASASSTEHRTDTSGNVADDGKNVVVAADVLALNGKNAAAVLMASPSIGTYLTDFVDLNGNVKSANRPENEGGNSAAMMEETWERLRKSYVNYFNGSPVGTLAALDPTA